MAVGFADDSSSCSNSSYNWCQQAAFKYEELASETRMQLKGWNIPFCAFKKETKSLRWNTFLYLYQNAFKDKVSLKNLSHITLNCLNNNENCVNLFCLYVIATNTIDYYQNTGDFIKKICKKDSLQQISCPCKVHDERVLNCSEVN